MRFYYFSLLSWTLWAVYGVIVITLVSLLWTKVLKLRLRNPAYWVLAIAILAAPWIEELWIAYNFDRFCRKDAGVFIHKTVVVEGFYDDTTHWWRQLTQSSSYKFVESRDNVTGQLWRVERVGDEVRHFKIDKPTARHHFYMKTGGLASPVAHKIWKEETGVLDAQTGATLGRYIVYSRSPYWFYIALGQPPFGCDGPDGGPNTKHDALLIYRQVLVPAK